MTAGPVNTSPKSTGPESLNAQLSHLAVNGYLLLPGIFSPQQTDAAVRELDAAFAADANGSSMRTEHGSIYGARNLLQLWPGVARAWRQCPLPEIARIVLGPRCGLVRVLYFDKPPGHSWALPWHKDLTIAVRAHRSPSTHFCKPTSKAGTPHVEAPQWLLEKMLTVRWHLDAVTEENGPLKVMPGTHRFGKQPTSDGQPPVTILSQRGDVLLMRPLLSHCSNKSHESTALQRRILHFELAGVEDLPDGFAWHDFIPG
jgi:hypothetical protein